MKDLINDNIIPIMENFRAYTPTMVHFGKDVLKGMGDEARRYGDRALLVYGKGSVLRNGSYDTAVEQLTTAGIQIIEFDGIKPNPLVGDVNKAAQTGIDNKVDMIIAVGGGSVIDSAKIISVCIAEGCEGWDVMKGRIDNLSAIPLIAVLTLAATGTEMNGTAVLQNPDTREKIGFNHPEMYPRHSYLDPAYTITVPENYTAYGIADLIAHCLESFFGYGEATLSDRFVEAIIKEAMIFGPALLSDLQNYELREKIMWAATNALNGTTLWGRITGDWGVHAIGHALSFLYDTPHGASLTIAYPSWLRHIKMRDPGRIRQLGRHLYESEDIDTTIDNLENFFRSIKCPVTLGEIGITYDQKDEILTQMNISKSSGVNYRLDDADRKAILEMMFA